MFAALRRRSERRAAAHRAYGEIVARARAPIFYARWGVPDTLDGRFESLALHGFLVLNRLKRERAATRDFAQALFDIMFTDLDRGVRELGAGDMGVGRRVKAMARGFYGRIAAYEAGLGDDTVLAAALRRNLYGTVTAEDSHIAAIINYMMRQGAALAAVPVDILLRGDVPFAPIEG